MKLLYSEMFYIILKNFNEIQIHENKKSYGGGGIYVWNYLFVYNVSKNYYDLQLIWKL